MPASPSALARLHRQIRACTRCVEAGFIPRAGPVLTGQVDNRIMLIGQAPGQVEERDRRPFRGRAGRVLMGWLVRAGFSSEAQVRRHVYMTSVTKCFPGKGAGSGDRRPSRAEVELCRDHLERQLALIRPEVILLVGALAHERFLPGRHLGELVGRTFDVQGRVVTGDGAARPVLVPLPHPSGASRWLNDPTNVALLERALGRLQSLLRPYLDVMLVGA